MNDGFSGGAAVGFFKIYGLKVGMGMIGAALLYIMLPPLDKDGKFDRREFASRLAAAAICSEVFGDWAVAILGNVAWLHAADHKAAIYLMVGAPAWWIGRAVALWFHNRRAVDVGQMVKDVKETI